jgi:hypothetical protein
MCFRSHLSIFIQISKSRNFVNVVKRTHVDKVLLTCNEVRNLILKLWHKVTEHLICTTCLDVSKHYFTQALCLCNSYSLIRSVVCLPTGQWPLPKRVLQSVRSNDPSYSLPYPLISVRPSDSCLHLLPRLPVASILLSTFPLTTCFNWQFARKM